MISPQAFLPQGEAVAALLRQIGEGRMTHALLITGAAGIGKWTLARGLAAALLCEGEGPGERPCGRCRSCAQMETLSHPDLVKLELGAPLRPTDTKKSIPASDVEEMISRISLQGYQGDQHVVLIHQAEHMTQDAANKLLKTLEEPPEGTYFLLTCENADSLLPTIVSRCRPLSLHPWPEADVVRVLGENGFTDERAQAAAREAGGSFGKALSILSDESYWTFREEVYRDFLSINSRGEILAVSSRWKDRKDQAEMLFSTLESFFSRLTRVVLRILPASSISGCPEKWLDFSGRADFEDCSAILEAISLARRRVQNAVSFQAVIEQLILSLMEAVCK